jgi:hypothetical protein
MALRRLVALSGEPLQYYAARQITESRELRPKSPLGHRPPQSQKQAVLLLDRYGQCGKMAKRRPHLRNYGRICERFPARIWRTFLKHRAADGRSRIGRGF